MRAVAAIILLCAALDAADAEAYPDKEITLVNPFPATGPVEVAGSVAINKVLRLLHDQIAPSVTDALAWRMRQALSSRLGKPVILERRSRGRTVDAHRHVARAVPDGHTLILSGNATMVIYPRLVRDLPFDPLRDFVPVALVARMPVALVAGTRSPAGTTAQFITMARQAPGRLYLGSSGDFSTAHLAVELFKSATGTAIEHVSFNGGNAAVKAVAARQIEAALVPLPALLPYLNGGRVHLLGIAQRERYPGLPDAPTLIETGLVDFEVSGWYGLFVPAGTPDRVVAYISDKIAEGMASEQTGRFLLSLGLLRAHLGPRELAELMRAETARWGPMIDALYAAG
ncbi:MAG: tripartite tricarboxylate transporter substrate binding protein [Betaproteobacteria bacterium]|nr:tripartite tricarboxylate transporter substrate binding protein [Betaproteobacteria bacterium]